MFCVSSLAHRVLFAARRSWYLVDCDGPSPSRGGAPGAQGAAVAPLGEWGAAAPTYAGGVPGGAGHCPGSGVDPEVVAVVAVFDAGFAYDGFDDGDVMVVGERFESRTRRVRRIGHDVGAGQFFGDKIGADVGVGGVGGSESHSSDDYQRVADQTVNQLRPALGIRAVARRFGLRFASHERPVPDRPPAVSDDGNAGWPM